jgi:anti-sigma regulatory factor (Ser/Thr protein kinase)
VSVRHGGLAGRTVGVADRGRYMSRDNQTTSENEIQTSLVTSVSELETNIAKYVNQIAQSLFVVFDYFAVGDGIITGIVDKFVAGTVS